MGSPEEFVIRILLVLVALISAGCATTGGAGEESEPTRDRRSPDPPAEAAASIAAEAPKPQEEVEAGGRRGSACRCRVRATRRGVPPRSSSRVASATVTRRSTISSPKAQTLLRDVELQYVLTGKGKRQTLRGRPVAFALWSEAKQEWTVAHIELPRPPIKWKPGRKPLAFRTLTPGIQARHVKGTGAERLMFAFSAGRGALKVYGRKFPVFDNKLVKRKQWRAVVQTAKPIVYLPFTEDTFDPGFVSGGKEFLVATARQGARGAASREGAERGLSGRAARRCHSSRRSSRHLRSSSRPTTGTTWRSRRSPSTRC